MSLMILFHLIPRSPLGRGVQGAACPAVCSIMGSSKIEGLHAKALELSLPNQGRKSFLRIFWASCEHSFIWFNIQIRVGLTEGVSEYWDFFRAGKATCRICRVGNSLAEGHGDNITLIIGWLDAYHTQKIASKKSEIQKILEYYNILWLNAVIHLYIWLFMVEIIWLNLL
jgi:hypothetical protein